MQTLNLENVLIVMNLNVIFNEGSVYVQNQNRVMVGMLNYQIDSIAAATTEIYTLSYTTLFRSATRKPLKRYGKTEISRQP